MKKVIYVLAVCFAASTSQAGDVGTKGVGSRLTTVHHADCITIDSSNIDPNAEVDFYRGECPGFGGYRVTVEGGDVRYSLNLSYRGVKIPTVKLGPFHDMHGSSVTWRYKRHVGPNENTIEYKALIYALEYADAEGNMDNVLHVVVALRGNKSCVTAKIKDSPGAIEAIATVADNPKAPCVKDVYGVPEEAEKKEE